MKLNDLLNPKEYASIGNLSLTLKLRKNLGCLILIGVNSEELGDAFCSLLEEELGTDNFCYFSPPSDLILYDMVVIHIRETLPLEKFFIIRLDNTQHDRASRKMISAGLLFYRDFIGDYSLKLIFIFDHELFRRVMSDAYDFFAFNNFAGYFHDNRGISSSHVESL